MATIMAQPRSPTQNFFAFLTRPHFAPRDVLEPDFDEDENRKPLTAEGLDWTRAPVRATD